MNEKEKQSFKKLGDKIADILNKDYVQKVMPKHGDLMNVFPDGVPEKYKKKGGKLWDILIIGDSFEISQIRNGRS